MHTQRVEEMEIEMKRDVIREVLAGSGRILLHDEVEERPGVFSIIPQWEDVSVDDILTPRDVFNLMVKEGFKVRGVFFTSRNFNGSWLMVCYFWQINYDRVAIVSIHNCWYGRHVVTTKHPMHRRMNRRLYQMPCICCISACNQGSCQGKHTISFLIVKWAVVVRQQAW